MRTVEENTTNTLTVIRDFPICTKLKEKRKRVRTLSEGERSVARGGSKRTSNMLMKSSSPVGNQGLNEVVVPHLLITQVVVAVAVLPQVSTLIKALDQTLGMIIAKQQMRQTNHSMTTILSMNSTGKTLMWTWVSHFRRLWMAQRREWHILRTSSVYHARVPKRHPDLKVACAIHAKERVSREIHSSKRTLSVIHAVAMVV